MVNNKNGFEIDGGWVATGICMVLIFPIGLIMLWNKLKNFKKGQNESGQVRKIGISVIVAGVAMMLLRISRVWAILESLVGVYLVDKARRMDNAEKRRHRYIALIGTKTRASLREIARIMEIPVDQVSMELQEMIEKGYFGLNVYIDKNSMEIILDGSFSEQTYYTERVVYAEPESTDDAEPIQTKVNLNKQTEPNQETVAEDWFDEKDEYGQWILSLRKVNDDIADEVISEKIERIEKLTRKIFETVRAMPEKQGQIRKFMNYYLPTTLKLLESYALLESQEIEGENISASKKRIADIMDTLIQGFEKQLDLLFSAQAMDITSDIDVLESMMSMDGLKDSQFNMRKPSAK